MLKYQLEMVLLDQKSEPVQGATVIAEPEALGEPALAEYDSQRQSYFINDLRPGFFRITIHHPDFLEQSVRVQAHPRPTELTFTLVPETSAYTFRGGTRVPYESQPDLMGIIPAAETEQLIDNSGQSFSDLLDSLGLVPADSPFEADAVTENRRPRRKSVPGALIVRRSNMTDSISDNANSIEELRVLRESPLVEAAGPLFNRSGEGFSVFTNRLLVRFRPEVTQSEVRELLADMQLRVVDVLAYSNNLFLAEADAAVGEGINRIAERLVNTGRVIYAEPNLAEAPEVDQIIPNDYLWPGIWDRQLVQLHDAWQRLHDAKGADAQFGSPQVIIAVIDEGIKSVAGVPENPDFQGSVSDGSSKTYKLFDFTRMVADNDRPFADHGVACAGVATGLANNPPGAATGIGVAGAAPNARLIGLIYPVTEHKRHQMFVWAAGLNARSNEPNFPQQISPGADIFTCSMGFGKNSPLSGSAKDMFDYITTRGRNGKGCLAIFSAGNDNLNVENFRPYGTYERSFSCAASTLNSSNQEVRAPYSGWGKIAWCAPSHSDFPVFHNPPDSFATWTASFLNNGNLPSSPATVTTLLDDANPGDTSIRVNSVNGLNFGASILIGDPGSPGSESVMINGTPNPANGIVPVRNLANDHRASEKVIGGANHHCNNFGGTSSATPLSAGICALVISANPRLTWVEAREILRSTTVKFDTGNTDPVGRWLDVNGEPVNDTGLEPVFSRWYGFGRLNADAAVEAALNYTFPRDLMIRKDLNDTGAASSATFADSPDIWVRNADPSIDPAPIPAGFNEAGPHQSPASSGGRWIYARVKNRGTEPSLDAWVRFYVASFTGVPFIHPADWEPRNGLGNLTPANWERGTYMIGEVALPHINAGDDFIVNIPWPDELMPPPVALDGQPWNPHILVEVTPHDGPLEGALIEENNNLAQKAIVITDDLTDAVIIANGDAESES